jgi:uncharacterized protein (TIGR03067 family)
MNLVSLSRTAACGLLLFASGALADDLEKLAGKWSVNKTNDQGQAYTQSIEIKKDKFTFRIMRSDGTLRLYATGDVKLDKLGPFNVMKLTNIKAGQSESDTGPLDDDRALIYQLEENSWTVASNFDKERNQKPAVDVYRRADK